MGTDEQLIADRVAEVEEAGGILPADTRLWNRVRDAIAAASAADRAEAERFLREGPWPGPAEASADGAPGDGTAAGMWRDKLRFLLNEEVIASDASQKFAIRARIQEARAKVQELGG